MAFKGRSDYVHGSTAKIGILLINLGTPASLTVKAIRAYLREFLSDPRVVEIPRPLWWLILNLFILPFRPGKLIHAYRKIWTSVGSPLATNTLLQALILQDALKEGNGENTLVTYAMCYGQPSIAQKIDYLLQNNVQKLLILPLYPQYSATTTAAVFDLVAKSLQQHRWIPELRFITDYHDEPSYIDACVQRIRSQRTDPQRPLLFSFHGLPRKNLLMGDPYHCYCHASAYQIAQRLGLDDNQWFVSFQSRFGFAEWLQPYTDQLLQSLPAKGIREIDVFCPGFSSDCLETLEEIAIQNRDFFLAAGGKTFQYLSALNTTPEHIACLHDLIKKHTAGWEVYTSEEQNMAARKRALELGAAQ